MDRIGVLFTLAAYLLWGLFPLYFHALQDVSALEILAHRIVWSLVVTAAILMALRRGEWIRGLVKEPRTLAIFTGSALLIGLNWGTYVYPEFADLFYAYGVLDSGRFIGESSHLVGLGSNQASFYLRA